MIEVTFTHQRMTVQGHAEYAPHGKDIVCAAVSALAYALIGALEEDGLIRELVVRPGFMTVVAKKEDKAFDVVRCGILQIAARYPQCVSIRK
ncbi:MAG: ribosomal-processing cysteine protease Prp [Eubacteriales bacterium]|nr:ribosomal-processing cysteine protease Prp [Eubacteriales bacterium]